MIKIVSIVGTRPQFLKLAPLCHELKKYNNINHIIVNTGQHFDKNMSLDIFDIFKLPNPTYQLNINNMSHANMTGNMMIEIEKILIKEKPNYVLVYGDCDTTLAGAITAKKLELKLIHVESGMRSYNRNMPEEINRVITDHLADILLCPNNNCIENLKKENITNNLHIVGNLQIDLLRQTISEYDNKNILLNNGLDNYILLTIHRHYNTDPDIINKIFNELKKIDKQVFYPIHPRTKNIIIKNNINIPKNIILHDPVNYQDMTVLMRNCYLIITDSGGIQSEAWILKKKCIVMRSETEWTETLLNNNNILFDINNTSQNLSTFIEEFMNKSINDITYEYNASKNIIDIIISE